MLRNLAYPQRRIVTYYTEFTFPDLVQSLLLVHRLRGQLVIQTRCPMLAGAPENCLWMLYSSQLVEYGKQRSSLSLNAALDLARPGESPTIFTDILARIFW